MRSRILAKNGVFFFLFSSCKVYLDNAIAKELKEDQSVEKIKVNVKITTINFENLCFSQH